MKPQTQSSDTDMPLSLAEIVRDPALLNQIHADAVPQLLRELSLVQGVLVARLHDGAANGTQPPSEDRLLMPGEAASRLNVSLRWLYRHARHFPFTVRLSRKALRFQEAGLRRYIETQAHLTRAKKSA